MIVFMPAAAPQAQTIPAEITANARVNTGAVSGDADDPAIWIHPTNPALSLVIGTDKTGNFVYVWDMNGQQLQRVSVSRTPNNGDVRYGMEVGGAPVDIYVVGAQSPSRLVIFKIDPNTRTLSDITAAGGAATPQVKEPYGVCLYRRASDGAMYAFVNSNGGVSGVLNQYQLLDNGAGQVKAVFVRSFGGEVNGKHSEGMVADDQLGYVYIAEEDCCVHKFYADPAMGNARLAVFAHADGIESDREGLGIYGCADGTGYILLSSQGNNRVKVYRREGDPGNPHSHTLVTPFTRRTSAAPMVWT
ncbi:MAG: phytase [candidate division KSB1 bacterium]|nr:phytase [candidate division KSB1 bacterium]MDZ7365004.1 phytase [candidate division KSB1 bacterium]